MVFEILSAILPGFAFFDKNEIIIDAHKTTSNTRIHFSAQPYAHKRQQQTKTSQQPAKDHAKNQNKLTLSPGEPKSVELIPSEESDTGTNWTSRVYVKFEKLGIGLTRTLDKLTENQTTNLININTTEVPIHIRQDSPVTILEIITQKQVRT